MSKHCPTLYNATETNSTYHASLSFFLGYLMRGRGRHSCERWARRKRLPLWNWDSSQRMVSRALPISLFSSSNADTTEHSQQRPHFFQSFWLIICKWDQEFKVKFICAVWNSEKAWSIIRYRYIWTIWVYHLNCCAVLMFVKFYNVQRRNEKCILKYARSLIYWCYIMSRKTDHPLTYSSVFQMK